MLLSRVRLEYSFCFPHFRSVTFNCIVFVLPLLLSIKLTELHFGSDTADIRIRIRIWINPEIWISIPNRIWSWRSLRSLTALVYFDEQLN